MFVVPLLQDREWLVDKYCNEQLCAEKIGVEAGCTKHGVLHVLKIGVEAGCTKHGVLHALRRFGIPIRKRSSKFPKLNDKEWVRKAYCEDRLSLKQIAKLAGCTFGTIATVLRILGIQRRGMKESLETR